MSWRTVALMGVLLVGGLAGCLQRDGGQDGAGGPSPSGSPSPPPGKTVVCDAPPDEAFVLLENQSDHSGGRTTMVTIFPNGTFLVLEGDAFMVGPGQVRVLERAEALGLERACLEVHRYPDTWDFGYQLDWVREGLLDPQAIQDLRGELVGFFDLEEDESAGCRSGADSWMRVTSDGGSHAVTATCGPTAEFQAYQSAVRRATEPPEP